VWSIHPTIELLKIYCLLIPLRASANGERSPRRLGREFCILITSILGVSSDHCFIDFHLNQSTDTAYVNPSQTGQKSIVQFSEFSQLEELTLSLHQNEASQSNGLLIKSAHSDQRTGIIANAYDKWRFSYLTPHGRSNFVILANRAVCTKTLGTSEALNFRFRCLNCSKFVDFLIMRRLKLVCAHVVQRREWRKPR